MKIFPAEINDGLEQSIRANASIAICSEVEKYVPTNQELNQIKKAIAENQNQKDLYYMKSILVSTGKNKNHDVFYRDEILKARTTPVDKQFNFMHKENDIIGHITGSYIADFDGNKIDDFTDVSKLPVYFDIVINSVLYASWGDPVLQARMNEIIDNIEHATGKWGVSMECLFDGFDYHLVDDGGNEKIIERNASSAFLTKHLAAYGGSGKYQNYSLGRLLRDFTYSGVGLVDKPANPRSIILSGKKGKINMSQDVIQSESSAAKDNAELNTLKRDFESAKAALLKANEDLIKVQAELSTAKDQLVKVEAEKKEVESNLNTVSASLAQIKAEQTKAHRKSQLILAGLDEVKAEERVSSLQSLNDEAFASIVDLVSSVSKVSQAKTDVAEKSESKKKDEECETEKDEKEADASVLNTAKASESFTLNLSPEEPDMKAFAGDWFKNVVNSVIKTK